MKEQKQGGKILTLEKVKALLRKNHLVALLAVKQTFQSFMSKKTETVQTHIAKSATKTDAKNAGTQEAGLTDGRHVLTNMALRNNFSLICTTNKRENVPYVGISQQLKEVCMSIIAMQLKKFGGFFATDATLVLGHSKRTPKFFLKQSVI